MYDFQKSYIKWLTNDNTEGIFKISSILEVTNQSKLIEKYILGELVLAGRMFKKNLLVRNPEYTFQIIVGNNSNLIRRVNIRRGFLFKRSSSKIEENSFRFKYLNAHLFKSKLTKTNCPPPKPKSNIQIAISKNFGSYKVNSYSPLKHWNFKSITANKKSWQIETGPILWINEVKKIQDICLKSTRICFIHANNNNIGTISYDFPSLALKEKPYLSKLKISFYL